MLNSQTISRQQKLDNKIDDLLEAFKRLEKENSNGKHSSSFAWSKTFSCIVFSSTTDGPISDFKLTWWWNFWRDYSSCAESTSRSVRTSIHSITFKSRKTSWLQPAFLTLHRFFLQLCWLNIEMLVVNYEQAVNSSPQRKEEKSRLQLQQVQAQPEPTSARIPYQPLPNRHLLHHNLHRLLLKDLQLFRLLHLQRLPQDPHLYNPNRIQTHRLKPPHRKLTSLWLLRNQHVTHYPSPSNSLEPIHQQKVSNRLKNLTNCESLSNKPILSNCESPTNWNFVVVTWLTECKGDQRWVLECLPTETEMVFQVTEQRPLNEESQYLTQKNLSKLIKVTR